MLSCFQFVYRFPQYFRHTCYSLTEIIDIAVGVWYNVIEAKAEEAKMMDELFNSSFFERLIEFIKSLFEKFNSHVQPIS